MVNQATPSAPAVGGCLRCHQLFLIIDSAATCLICGRPPDLTLPFGPFPAAGLGVLLGPSPAAEEPEAPILIAVKCPHCDNDVQLSITDTEIAVVSPAPLLPAEEAGPEPPPPTEPAPPPAATTPAPAMAHDVFGNPIEGPPAETPGATIEETPE